MTDAQQTFIDLAVDLALQNVEEGGKPFGCVVVRDGEVVVQATNHVAQTGDPTAHAEVMALRAAAEQGVTSLEGHDVYVTAYPCPMCLGALYYAQPARVFFAATREQEGEHYEDGNRLMTLATFYDEYAKPVEERNLAAEQLPVADPAAPFTAWKSRHPDE